MRKIDFISQTILLAASGIFLFGSLYRHEMLYLFLCGQLFIGIWQYGSTLMSFMSGTLKYRKKYFLVATSYLAGIFIMVSFGKSLPSQILLMYFFIPSWWLALYYYRMTWRSFFIRYKNASGFLPHTNF
jgi:hypothetical protein